MTDWAKKANWLWAAGIFTFVYLMGALWLVGTARVWTFITTGDLNEIGDFLAGVFSPLAFIWLVAAVLTQRQELEETRDQFGENQKVVDAQMKTISSQNELLALQHQQAEESAKQTYKLSLFDKRFGIFTELLKVKHSMESKFVIETEWEDLERIAKRSSFVFNSEISLYLQEVSNSAFELIVMTQKHEAAWFIDPSVGGEYPDDPGSVSIRGDYDWSKLMIEQRISLDALNDLMRSSLRVSDD